MKKWDHFQIQRLKQKRCPRFHCGKELRSDASGYIVCSRRECGFQISRKDRNVAIGMCDHGVNPGMCYHGCGNIR